VERASTKRIHEFILENVESYPTAISAKVAEKFGISKQAANRHVQRLVQSGILEASGNRRNRKHALMPLRTKLFRFELKEGLEEDRVWARDIRPAVASLAGC
jgi:predicted transcriptional regulator